MTKMSGPLPGFFSFLAPEKTSGSGGVCQVGLGVMGCVGWTDCGNGDWAGAGFGSWAACGGSGVAAAGWGQRYYSALRSQGWGQTARPMRTVGRWLRGPGAFRAGAQQRAVRRWVRRVHRSRRCGWHPRPRRVPGLGSQCGSRRRPGILVQTRWQPAVFPEWLQQAAAGWGHPVPRLPGSVQLPARRAFPALPGAGARAPWAAHWPRQAGRAPAHRRPGRISHWHRQSACHNFHRT